MEESICIAFISCFYDWLGLRSFSHRECYSFSSFSRVSEEDTMHRNRPTITFQVELSHYEKLRSKFAQEDPPVFPTLPPRR